MIIHVCLLIGVAECGSLSILWFLSNMRYESQEKYDFIYGFNFLCLREISLPCNLDGKRFIRSICSMK